MSLANLVPADLSVSSEQADVLLELAFLTTAVDGRLDDEELSHFREIAGRLRGKATSNAELDALLARLGGRVDRREVEERVNTIAPTLSGALRDLAFKLAVGLSVVDLDASRHESDFVANLADALGLDDERVDALTAEVYAGLDAGED